MAVQPFSGSWPLFHIRNLDTIDRATWTGNEPVGRPIPTHRITQTQNKCTYTSVPRKEFEPTIPEFERAKSVNTLVRAATAIDLRYAWSLIKRKFVPELKLSATL
jgi:hypothetical protein